MQIFANRNDERNRSFQGEIIKETEKFFSAQIMHLKHLNCIPSHLPICYLPSQLVCYHREPIYKPPPASSWLAFAISWADQRNGKTNLSSASGRTPSSALFKRLRPVNSWKTLLTSLSPLQRAAIPTNDSSHKEAAIKSLLLLVKRGGPKEGEK